jgi:hypothetical protein
VYHGDDERLFRLSRNQSFSQAQRNGILPQFWRISHGVLYHVTIRDVLQSINLDKFSDAFNKDINGISPQWIGLKRLVRVERNVCSKGKQTHETAYFISVIRCNKADFFAKHIRNHWVKDVVMNEDRSMTTSGKAAQNLSVIRNIVINHFRLNGQYSIKYAIELCANNFKDLLALINYKTHDYKII